MRATFEIIFAIKILPVQLIYEGKTARSLPHVTFPESFLLSTNKNILVIHTNR